MTLIEFVNRAMNVPFVESGRDYDGWDCWGLVVCCQRDVYNRTLPTFSGEYGSTARRDELKRLVDKHKDDHWALTKTPQPGDLVLLEMLGRPCHIGVMIDHRRFVHTESRCNTMVERIDREPWRGKGYNKVEGVYCFVG